MSEQRANGGRTGPGPAVLALLVGLAAALPVCGGCSSIFNPAFLNLVASPPFSEDDAGFDVGTVTINNASGHVPIVFINNTRFDPNLLDYLDSVGVDVSDPNLRPRIRIRTQIRYVNGNTNEVEFLDGSSITETVGDVAGVTPPPGDLTSGDLTNVVAACDVSLVAPGIAADNTYSVEVYVPVYVFVFEFVQGALGSGTYVLKSIWQPQFMILLPDETDDNGNVTLQQNFDIRDVPVPATELPCGSVVGFTLTGTVQVPLIPDGADGWFPAYLDGDTTSEGAMPGRFEFQTTVR